MKKYSPPTLILLGGIVIFVLYLISYFVSDYDVKGGVRLLGYISFLLILLGACLVFWKKKKLIMANVSFTLLLILLVEVTCFFLLGMPGSHKKTFSLPDLPPDHIGKNIGDVMYADSVYHSVKVNDRDTVYDVHYSIDHYCKRTTPGHDSLKKKHALFFGCSLTFGEGVDDDKTLPYYFQQVNSESNGYNYGISGHGTNHMLARLQFQPLTQQVKEKDGVAYYVFFWDHMYRSIGSMDRYCDWLTNAPYFKMKDGKLVRDRMFKDGRYFTSKFYELVYQTNIIKYFKIGFPTEIRDDHIDLVTEMISESKKEYAKQFGNDRFYCVIYPFWKAEAKTQKLDVFKQYLTKKGIKYIDLSDIEYKSEMTLGGDPHPNPATHKMIAERLNAELLKSHP